MPMIGTLTPLSRYPPVGAAEEGHVSKDVTKYDRREVDTNTIEGRVHVGGYLNAVMGPSFAFMRLVGLYHVSSIKSLNATLIVYGLLITAVQCIAAFRRVSLLQFGVLNVQTASAIISAIFICSGAVATMYLFRLGSRLHELHATVLRELAQYDRDMKHVRHVRAFSILLVVAVVIICSLIVASHAVVLYRFNDGPLQVEPLFTKRTVFVDLYVLFIGECAILMCAAVFILLCNVLSRSTQLLVKHMNDECEPDQTRVTPAEAIQRIGYFQKRFQSLQEAVDEVNGQFSYVHLYVVMVSVPMLCFVLYVAFQERCDSRFTWLQISAFGFWGIHVLFLFLIFTIPAVRLLEQSQEISSISFRIYNDVMVENQNDTLISLAHFFADQVTTAPFSFTAGGFFTISRGIILTLLSATFSYFMILRGFSTDQTCDKATQ